MKLFTSLSVVKRRRNIEEITGGAYTVPQDSFLFVANTPTASLVSSPSVGFDSFILSENNISYGVSYVLGNESFSFQDSPISLDIVSSIEANTESFNFLDNNVNIIVGLQVVAGGDSFLLVSQQPQMSGTSNINVGQDTFGFVGVVPIVSIEPIINVTADGFSFIGQTVNLTINSNPDVPLEQFLLQDYVPTVTVDVGELVNVAFDNFSFLDNTITLTIVSSPTVSADVFSLAHQTPTLTIVSSPTVTTDGFSFVDQTNTLTIVSSPEVSADTFSLIDNTPTVDIAQAQQEFLRPTGDISVGSWTPTPLFEQIDEATASDTDFIETSNNPSNDIAEVSLGDPSGTPDTAGTWTVRYRYGRTSGSRSISITVHLMEGTTSRASWSHSNVSTGFTQADQALSQAEKDSISNINDLRLRFVADTSGGGSPSTATVSWGEIEVQTT